MKKHYKHGKVEFALKHKDFINHCIDELKNGNWKSLIITDNFKSFIKTAREELGYSKNTGDRDIIYFLNTTLKPTR